MPERGHQNRLLPVIAALAARDRKVVVMTDARFRRDVERRGGDFFDLFGRFPIELADATSTPIPCRYVSFAGTYAAEVIELMRTLDPDLIVHDSFAVVAAVAARQLRVPYVNLCCGHALVPERVQRMLRNDQRVAVSDSCHAAVQRLRDDYGMPEAGPFSYVETLSPYLNLYGEPPEFLNEEDRGAFEPVAFFGSLSPTPDERAAARGAPSEAAPRRIYVSFGTVIWRYYAEPALAALRVLCGVFAKLDVEVTVSLGGHDLDARERARLERPNVRVEDYVDQWSVLSHSDAFVTHHGLNSTHEAIFHQVPLISYPFFGDQPALARRCQALGLAVSLTERARAPIEPASVLGALDALARERDRFARRLSEARAWELAVIDARPAVVDRILALRTEG